MKNNLIVFLLILSLAMNVAVLTVVGYNFYFHGHQPLPVRSFSTQKNHHFYQTLGLTPVQQKSMESLATLFHHKLEALNSTMKIKKDSLVKLLSQKNIDQNQIDRSRKQIAVIQENIQRIVISHLLDVKRVLDENQQERFFALLHKSMNTDQCFFLNNRDQ
ncbi:MAG: periplasmic heavy metal sensor [Deltaproteobacteria bacterium]|nr:periplasmic heavy metal sensor [Candidatus Desulfobacula maris]